MPESNLAPQSRRPWSVRLRGRAGQYEDALRLALRRLTGSPIGTAMTAAVMGLMLVLPSGLALCLRQADAVLPAYAGALDLSVYLRPHLEEALTERAIADVRALEGLASTRVVTPAEGIEDFRHWTGMAKALAALPENPLPTMIVVRPRPESVAAKDGLEPLIARLRAIPGVDQVRVDNAWVSQFQSVLRGLRRAVRVLGVLLSVAAVFVIGNTIRLDFERRRTEIEILRSIGADQRFLQRPFLCEGVCLGFAGGLVAWLVMLGAWGAMAEPLGRIAAAYGRVGDLGAPGIAPLGALLIGGSVIGFLGAWAAAKASLRAQKPGV